MDERADPLQRSQQRGRRSRQRGGQKAGGTMPHGEPRHRFERLRRRLHHIMTAPAVDMDVDETGRQNFVAQLHHPRTLGNSRRLARTNTADGVVFDDHHSVDNFFQGSE